MVTYAQFIALFPEFADIPDAATSETVITAALGVEDASVSDCAFGPNTSPLRDRVVMLRAAHWLALRYKINVDGMLSQQSTGVVTSMSASTGGLSKSMAQNAMVTGNNPFKAYWSKTNYGLEYLMILSETIAPGRVAGFPS